MAIKSLVPPSKVHPKMQMKRIPPSIALQKMLSDQFDFSTILLLGALIQGVLLLMIPRIWILFPALAVLLMRFGKTLAITFALIPNPYMEGAILHRATAIVPDSQGEFNTANSATNEKITVFMLVAQINHPLGVLAPKMNELTPFTTKMVTDLDNSAPDNGFLGQTEWTTKSENGSLNVMMLSYWRSMEDVLAFSVGPLHRETWAWWNSNQNTIKHIGISHEIYEADRQMYENVYLNFSPTLLGATTYLRKGDQSIGGTVPDAWISPLVDASKGKFKTSKGRLGWKADSQRDAIIEKLELGTTRY